MIDRFNSHPNLGRMQRLGLLAMASGVLAGTLLFSSVARCGSIFDDDFVPPALTKPVAPEAGVPAPTPPGVPDKPQTPDAPPVTPSAEPSSISTTPVASTVPPARRAVPAAAEQAKSRKLFKEVFATELANHSPAGRRGLAAKLLEQSSKLTDAPVDQFVLLVGASQAGKEACDLDICCQAADAMADAYDVDALRVKCDVAMKMPLRADNPAATADNCRAGLKLVDDLLAAADYATSFRLLQLLRSAAPDGEVSSEIQVRLKQVESLRAAGERVAPYIQKLKASPDDAPANLAVGEYLCFSKDDWKSGLPLIVKGGVHALSDAAALDLAAAADAVKQIEIGDAWWTASEKETGPTQLAVRQRAAMWYGKAIDSGAVPGLRRALLEKRIAEGNATHSASGWSHATAASGPSHAASALHVTIVKAEYGAGTRQASVTKRVQALLDADPFAPVQSTTDAMKADAAPYTHKTLTVTYRFAGSIRTGEAGENEVVVVPSLPKEGLLIAGASSSFRIVAARYGVDTTWLDVTEEIRKDFKDPTKPVKLHGMAGGKDLHNGVVKHIIIYFEMHGRLFARIYADNETAALTPAE